MKIKSNKLKGLGVVLICLSMLFTANPINSWLEITAEVSASTIDYSDTSLSAMRARAEAIVNYTWTPSRRIYTWNGNRYNGKNYFEAGETVVGVPYTLFTTEVASYSLVSLEQYKSKVSSNYSTSAYCVSVGTNRIGPVYGSCCADFICEVFGGNYMNGNSMRYHNVTSIKNSSYGTTSYNVSANSLKAGDAVSNSSGTHIIWIGEVTDSYFVVYEQTPPVARKVIIYKSSAINSNGYLVFNGSVYNIVTRSNQLINNESCSCSTSYAGNYTVNTSSQSLNMRSGHGTAYGVVTTIPKDATVYVSKSDGTWAHVEYNGYSGYCSMSYLKKKEELPFVSAFDSPTDVTISGLDGELHLLGWAVDASGIDYFTYSVDGGYSQIYKGYSREDIVKNYSNYPTENSAYSIKIPYEEIRYGSNYPTNSTITLKAISKDGVEHHIATINVTREKAEKNNPTISNVQITDIGPLGYTVTAEISDDSDIDRVQFPSWTAYNSQDDLGYWVISEEYTGTISNGKVTYFVKTSDHNFESGAYATHIYAYDIYGNVSATIVDTQNIQTIESAALDLGSDFYAEVENLDSGLVLATSKSNPDKPDINALEKNAVFVDEKSDYKNAKQLWHFIKNSDGTYTISTGLSGHIIDLANASTDVSGTIWIRESNDSNAQRWYIIKNGDGYSFVPKCATNMVMDVQSNSHTPGTYVWSYYATYLNKAQMFDINTVSDIEDYQASIESIKAYIDSALSMETDEYLSEDTMHITVEFQNTLTGEVELYCNEELMETHSVTNISGPQKFTIENPKEGIWTVLVVAENALGETDIDGKSLYVSGEEYIVSYDKNGGTKVPQNQKKIYGKDLTLETGYDGPSYTATFISSDGVSLNSEEKTITSVFKSWNTKADGSGKNYLPGDKYIENTSIKLYAQYSGAKIGTLPVPTSNEYSFVNWNTKADGSGKIITENSTVSNDIVLYAQWELKTTATPSPTPVVTAIPTATPKPTATPTPKPTATSTPEPTATPTPKPTATSTPEPTATPRPEPTVTSTPEPTTTSMPESTATPTPESTIEPTATPTMNPMESMIPTETPSTSATPMVYELGDVDNSGKVDAADALLVLKQAAKLTELSEVQKLAADVTKESKIDATDALQILKYAARIIDSFE